MKEGKSLTSEESLEIITKMIQNAKGNIKGNSFQFLLWGWVVLIGNLGQYIITEYTEYDYPYIIWLGTIPVWIISMMYGYRKSNKQRVTTYSDSLIMWIWLGFLFSLLIVIFSGRFAETIPSLILILAGLCAFMTGLIIKFKPLIYGASSFWVFAAIILAVDYTYAPLLSAIATFIGYLVPGYMLKKS